MFVTATFYDFSPVAVVRYAVGNAPGSTQYIPNGANDDPAEEPQDPENPEEPEDPDDNWGEPDDGWGEPDAPSGYDPDFSKGQILCSWESIVIRLTLKED